MMTRKVKTYDLSGAQFPIKKIFVIVNQKIFNLYGRAEGSSMRRAEQFGSVTHTAPALPLNITINLPNTDICQQPAS